MMRDSKANIGYWDKCISYGEGRIASMREVDRQPGGDLNYRPQYIYEIAKKIKILMLQRYSRGDDVSELKGYFPAFLDAWEESEKLGENVWSDNIKTTRNSWAVNIDHYSDCFWMAGLAITLNVTGEDWSRLVKLMGNEGEDALLDRVISFRDPDRTIGNSLCFPKAYRSLLDVTEAPRELQPVLLRQYLDGWLAGLKDAGSPSFPKAHRTPWWWNACVDTNRSINGGYYMGCWCIEAAVVAKVFDIDDSICLDHSHYPGDLLEDGRSPRYGDKEMEKEKMELNGKGSDLKGAFMRLFRRGINR